MVFRLILVCLCLIFSFAIVIANESRDLTVRVIAPSMTSPHDTVYIAGNLPELGNWNPGQVSMIKMEDDVWEFTIQVSPGTVVEFKITCGSWLKQAFYQRAVAPSNTIVTVERDTILELKPIGWGQDVAPNAGGITGSVAYHRGLRGDGLNYPRDLIVWLPPSYSIDTTKHYPVLYLHDGNNMMDPATSFLGVDWRVDEVADSLIRSGKMEEIIMVGIYNTPDRRQEYRDSLLGRAYARFVVERVKPMIDSTYRTLSDPGHTAVMGSSMGGLISFLFVWWYPQYFSKAACLSSAFHPNYTDGVDLVKKNDAPRRDIRFYLDCGGVGLDAELKPGMDEMERLLRAKGYGHDNSLEIFYDPEAEHNEQAWSKRVWRPLLFLFSS